MRKYSASGSNFVKRFFDRNKGNLLGGFRREVKGKLLRNNITRTIVTRFYSCREPEKWLFLVGCYNSGTTILREVISSHDEVDDLPFEGVRLTSAFPDLEEGGWPRMMYKNRSLWKLPTENGKIISEKAKKDWSPWWKAETKIFLEKSIDQSTRIRWLAEHFPNSHFIYIIRNGYCVSEGIMRRAKPSGPAIQDVGSSYPAELVAKQWCEFSKFIEAEIDGLDNVLKVKYENLTDNPLDTITNIYNFLKLPAPEISVQEDAVIVNGKGFVLANQNNKSIERISPEDKAIMTDVMRDTLIEHNYELL